MATMYVCIVKCRLQHLLIASKQVKIEAHKLDLTDSMGTVVYTILSYMFQKLLSKSGQMVITPLEADRRRGRRKRRRRRRTKGSGERAQLKYLKELPLKHASWGWVQQV